MMGGIIHGRKWFKVNRLIRANYKLMMNSLELDFFDMLLRDGYRSPFDRYMNRVRHFQEMFVDWISSTRGPHEYTLIVRPDERRLAYQSFSERKSWTLRGNVNTACSVH